MCTGVFLHKHAQCYSTFVSGTDFSLAFGLLLCHTNNNLLVCANILYLLFYQFRGCCLTVSACWSVANYVDGATILLKC